MKIVRAGLATALAWSTLALICSSPALATDAAGWFNDAIRADAAGDAASAFASYRRAAEAGMPTAEFNVAVMLDSGRGVAADLAGAATWYARAAAHSDRRAAYNLGQLYEAGDGVPRNIDLARAWFASADLPAARGRLKTMGVPAADRTAALTPPRLVAPAPAEKAGVGSDGVEMVWTSAAQPEPVRFYVELRALDQAGSREVMGRFADTSSLLATLPGLNGDYAWRVLAVAREGSRYAASGWSRFSVAPR